MSFVTEILEEKPSVLIISGQNHQLIELLKEHLKRYQANVFFSPILPKNLHKFEYIFLINDYSNKKNLYGKNKKITLIYINRPKEAHFSQGLYKNTFIKIVSITGDKILNTHLDKILWFTFSQAKETFLHLNAAKHDLKIKNTLTLPSFRMPARKKVIIILVSLFLLLHVVFILPLVTSAYFLYQSASNLKQTQTEKAKQNLEIGRSFFNLAEGIYTIPQITFRIVSFTFPDYIFNNTERAKIVLEKSINLQQNAKEALKLVLNKNKTPDEKRLLQLRIATIKDHASLIEENISTLSQEFPPAFPSADKIRSDLTQYLDLVSRLNQILEHSDSLLAKDTEKNYLMLFANNMELRPGGGFIGSFGIMKVKDYTIEEIKIYDVYDADGQLEDHVEPPIPLRQYLNQPNWFLRDSAFSPDLLENYTQAKYFLQKEMGLTDFSGNILITTTAVQNILGAFPEIYLPNFNEKINQKNFYLKTQYYSEKNFFPGSIQKKNFLGTLAQTIMLDLENASPNELAKALKKSLDEKQLAFYFDDSELQRVIDSFYWSGRTIQQSCTVQVTSCISDYIFPIDANLGLNKVNFFITRNQKLKVTFDKNGKVVNNFTIRFNNESQDVFPGGVYRNYFQLYLPRNAELISINKNGVIAENYSEENDQYKKIGLLIEVPIKSSVEIDIKYELAEKLKKGRNIYQLIAQKQLGASNSDLQIELAIDKSTQLLNQNFPALVKNGRIIYNTSLSADKIFFVELIKE